MFVHAFIISQINDITVTKTNSHTLLCGIALSATFCFAISLILVDFFFEKSTRLEWIYLIVLSIVGFLTLSRAFVVCYVLIIMVYFLMACMRGGIKGGYLLLIPIATVIAYTLFYERIEDVLDMVIFRFTDSQYSGGGGRLEVWEWYLTQFISSTKILLFGSTPASTVYEAGLVKHIEHNTYIQLLYELGVTGSLIYIFTLCSPSAIYKRVLPGKKVRNHGIGFLPIIAVVGPYFFLSALTGENFILTFSFALIVKQCVDYFENWGKVVNK